MRLPTTGIDRAHRTTDRRREAVGFLIIVAAMMVLVAGSGGSAGAASTITSPGSSTSSPIVHAAVDCSGDLTMGVASVVVTNVDSIDHDVEITYNGIVVDGGSVTVPAGGTSALLQLELDTNNFELPLVATYVDDAGAGNESLPVNLRFNKCRTGDPSSRLLGPAGTVGIECRDGRRFVVVEATNVSDISKPMEARIYTADASGATGSVDPGLRFAPDTAGTPPMVAPGGILTAAYDAEDFFAANPGDVVVRVFDDKEGEFVAHSKNWYPSVPACSSDTQNPSAPAVISLDYGPDGTLTASWTQSTDNVGIDRYVVSRNGSVVADDVNATSATFVPGGAGDHFIQVRAVDTSGRHGNKSSPAEIDNLRVEPLADGTLRATWTGQIGAVEYEVLRNGVVDDEGLVSGTTLTFEPDGTNNHFIQMRALDAEGNPGPLTSPIKIDRTPRNPAAVILADGSVAVTWDAPLDPVGIERYWVYRNGAYAGTALGSTSLTFTPSGSGDHHIQVQAVDAGGRSSYRTAPLIAEPGLAPLSMRLEQMDGIRALHDPPSFFHAAQMSGRCVELASASECDSLPVFFSGAGVQLSISEHIADAQADGHPAKLTYLKRTQSRPVWSAAFPESHCATTTLSRSQCDEYPFWSTRQGYLAPEGGDPSLRRVHARANMSHGGSYGMFLRQCGLDVQTSPPPDFLVVPVHDLVAEDQKSFWTCGSSAPVVDGSDPTQPVTSGCVAQRVVDAWVWDPPEGEGSGFSPQQVTGWVFVWNLEAWMTSDAAYLDVDGNRLIDFGSYPLTQVMHFAGEYFDSSPFTGSVIIRNEAGDALATVPCASTTSGLDGIFGGSVIPWRTPCTHLGTAGDDVIVGSDGDDVICPLDGDDVVLAGDGNDRVLAFDGANFVDAGAGDDVVQGLHGPLEVMGGPGADTLVGSSSDDVLAGGDDDDTIVGRSGDDIVHAGLGNDGLSGGDGDDVIVGGRGDDDKINTTSGYEQEFGDDAWIMGEGNDQVNELSGHNYIEGGPGNDGLYGGNSVDVIFTGTGRDHAEGGDGNDMIEASAEPLLGALDPITRLDWLAGGDGNDLIRHVSPVESPHWLAFSPVIHAGEGNDLVITLDGSWDSVHMEPAGGVTLGPEVFGCQAVASSFTEELPSTIDVECSFEFYNDFFEVTMDTNGDISVSQGSNYLLGLAEGLVERFIADELGLDALLTDACICDPTLELSRIVVLKDISG